MDQIFDNLDTVELAIKQHNKKMEGLLNLARTVFAEPWKYKVTGNHITLLSKEQIEKRETGQSTKAGKKRKTGDPCRKSSRLVERGEKEAGKTSKKEENVKMRRANSRFLDEKKNARDSKSVERNSISSKYGGTPEKRLCLATKRLRHNKRAQSTNDLHSIHGKGGAVNSITENSDVENQKTINQENTFSSNGNQVSSTVEQRKESESTAGKIWAAANIKIDSKPAAENSNTMLDSIVNHMVDANCQHQMNQEESESTGISSRIDGSDHLSSSSRELGAETVSSEPAAKFVETLVSKASPLVEVESLSSSVIEAISADTDGCSHSNHDTTLLSQLEKHDESPKETLMSSNPSTKDSSKALWDLSSARDSGNMVKRECSEERCSLIKKNSDHNSICEQSSKHFFAATPPQSEAVTDTEGATFERDKILLISAAEKAHTDSESVNDSHAAKLLNKTYTILSAIELDPQLSDDESTLKQSASSASTSSKSQLSLDKIFKPSMVTSRLVSTPSRIRTPLLVIDSKESVKTEPGKQSSPRAIGCSNNTTMIPINKDVKCDQRQKLQDKPVKLSRPRSNRPQCQIDKNTENLITQEQKASKLMESNLERTVREMTTGVTLRRSTRLTSDAPVAKNGTPSKAKPLQPRKTCAFGLTAGGTNNTRSKPQKTCAEAAPGVKRTRTAPMSRGIIGQESDSANQCLARENRTIPKPRELPPCKQPENQTKRQTTPETAVEQESKALKLTVPPRQTNTQSTKKTKSHTHEPEDSIPNKPPTDQFRPVRISRAPNRNTSIQPKSDNSQEKLDKTSSIYSATDLKYLYKSLVVQKPRGTTK